MQADSAPFHLKADETPKLQVLLLHGFTGTPWEVRPLGESLAAYGAEVTASLLPGHGGTPEELEASRFTDWYGSARDAFVALPEPRVIIGLSMGALLAVRLARNFSARAAVLLAPAFALAHVPRFAAPAMRRASRPLLSLLPRWIPTSRSDISLEDARREAPNIGRIPTAAVFELFALQEAAARDAPQVACPTLVVCAVDDAVASNSVTRHIVSTMPRATAIEVRGAHVMPRDVDRARVAIEVASFIGLT